MVSLQFSRTEEDGLPEGSGRHRDPNRRQDPLRLCRTQDANGANNEPEERRCARENGHGYPYGGGDDEGHDPDRRCYEGGE